MFILLLKKKNPNHTARGKLNTEPHRECTLHTPKGLKRILTDSVHFFFSALVLTGLPQTLSMKRWPIINVFETFKWHQVLSLYLGKMRTILFINNEVNSAFNLYFTSPLLYLRLLCKKGFLKFLKNLSFADMSHKVAALKSHITVSSLTYLLLEINFCHDVSRTSGK